MPRWKDTDLDGVIRYLEHPGTEYDGGSHGYIELPWALTAADYLKFARTDVGQAGKRGRVNALGNAKRALHAQVDAILYCAGFWTRPKFARAGFPAKTNILTELRIVTPSVLDRINRLRNKVEHEYSVPEDKSELEDFIEAVESFVNSTRLFTRARHDCVDFVRTFRGKPRGLEVVYLDSGNLEARIFLSRYVGKLMATTDSDFRRLQTAVYAAADRSGAALVA